MISLNTSTIQTILPDDASASRRPLLTPLSEPGHFLLVLDNSSLEMWKRCPVAAQNFLVKERQAHAKDAALTYGGAIHAGLEVLYRGKEELWPEREDAETEEDFLRRIVTTVFNYFTDNPSQDDGWRTPAVACEVLGHYRQRMTMPDYIWQIEHDADGPIIERAFELPLGVLEVGAYVPMPWLDLQSFPNLEVKPDGVFCSHIHVAWSGRIDVVATTNGRARIVDNKTSSIDGDQFTQSFQLASQTIGYVWAGQQLWPDLNVSSFCLNVLSLRKPTSLGDAGNLFAPGPRGGKPRLSFFRAFFAYSAERVLQWHADTLVHVSDFIHCLTRDHFPMNDSSCFNKYGRCQYHDACTIDDVVVRERFLQSDAYRQVTWNPVR